MSMVDAFLACRKIMPKWKDMDDSESIFCKFMHVVTGQLDKKYLGQSEIGKERTIIPFTIANIYLWARLLLLLET